MTAAKVAEPPSTSSPGNGEPGMSIVVPTLNRGGFLRDTLRDLLAQHHRPLEILVVDQSSIPDPDVAALVAANSDLLRHYRVAFRGLPRARNFGWQHVRYDYLLYVDDDIRCGPELVTEHLRVLTRPGVGLVGGGIDEMAEPSNNTAMPVFDRWSASPRGGFAAQTEGLAEHAKGCNFSARRDVLEQCGGADEALSAGAALYEETDLALRIAALGYEIRFNGAARLRHLAAASGGCRTDEVTEYVGALAHNRAVLIRRHCRGLQRPVAFAHLASTGLAFAWHYRTPGCLPATWRGARAGWADGGRRPDCTVSSRQSEVPA